MRTNKPKGSLFPFRKKAEGVKQPRIHYPPQAVRLVTEAFDAVPTVFGRLVLAAYLLHRDTGLYVCPLASVAYGYDEVNQLLEDTHRKLLDTWLVMTEAQQLSDIQGYLYSVDDDSHALANSILRTRSYGGLLPINVDPGIRKSFMKSVGHALRVQCKAEPLKTNCTCP